MAGYDGSIRFDTRIDKSGLERDAKSVKFTVENLFSSLRDVMQGPVAAINMIKDAMQGLGGATVGEASKIEDMVAAFTPLVGGADNAKKMIAALNKEAATTPYELNGIGKIAKQLLPVLGNNVEAVTKSFRMLGDTAGGNIEKLDSITRGYMKTMLKGKVDMESLNMIAEAGVPIYTELAKSMGVSVQRMTEMSSAGEISADALTKTFEDMTSSGGIFYNGMSLASQTLSGKVSTMTDNLKQAGAAIGNALLPSVKATVSVVSDAAGGFAKWANEAGNLKAAFAVIGFVGLAASIGPVVNGINAMRVALIALNTTALFGPAGIIVGIGLLVAALIELGAVSHNKDIEEINNQFSGLMKQTGITAENIDKIETSLANASKGEASFDDMTASVKQMSEDLGVSVDTVIQIGQQSKKVTPEFKKVLAAVQEYNDKLAESNRGIQGTPEWIKAQKEKEAALKAVTDALQDQKRKAKENAEAQAIANRLIIDTTYESYDAILRRQEQDRKDEKELAEESVKNAKTEAEKKAKIYRDWISSIGTVATAMSEALGGAATAAIQNITNIGIGITEVFATGGASVVAWAGLAASVIGGVAALFKKSDARAEEARKKAEEARLAAEEAAKALDQVLNSGKTSYNDYLGLKQQQDYLKKVQDAAKEAAKWKKLAETPLLYDREYNAAKAKETKKNAEELQYIYDKVYKDGSRITSDTAPILKEWAEKLQDVVKTYGTGSKEAAALNEYYQKLINEALYPTAAALDDNNAALKNNINLWKDASKATTAYETILSSLRQTASKLYESFAEIGNDIASTLVDNLVEGLNDGDFMESMRNYITKIVIQTAIFTDAMTAKIAAIGKKIAEAIANGVTGSSLTAIKDELAALYQAASQSMQITNDIMNQVFGTGSTDDASTGSRIIGYASGTSNAIEGWHLVGERGPELAHFSAGGKVINASQTASMISSAGAARAGSRQPITLVARGDAIVKINEREIGRAAFEMIDQVAGGSYGY